MPLISPSSSAFVNVSQDHMLTWPKHPFTILNPPDWRDYPPELKGGEGGGEVLPPSGIYGKVGGHPTPREVRLGKMYDSPAGGEIDTWRHR
jgi:hypothetical protein